MTLSQTDMYLFPTFLSIPHILWYDQIDFQRTMALFIDTLAVDTDVHTTIGT